MVQEENEEARIVVVRKKNFPELRKENMTTDGFITPFYCYKRGDENWIRMPLTRLLIIMGWNGMEIFP